MEKLVVSKLRLIKSVLIIVFKSGSFLFFYSDISFGNYFVIIFYPKCIESVTYESNSVYNVIYKYCSLKKFSYSFA